MFARFIVALSSFGKNRQIAFALTMGFVLSLIPPNNLIWFILFIPMMLFRVNQLAFLAALGLGRLLSFVVDPLSERLGFFVLSQDFLYRPMGRFLSNPIFGWTRLDDSLVAGSLILAAVLWIPCFIVMFYLVRLYRKFLAGKVKAAIRSFGKKLPWLGRFVRVVSTVRSGGLR
jgi:uncharacterized protein (TIGR03546 family)